MAFILAAGIMLLSSTASLAVTTTVEFKAGSFGFNTISVTPFNSGAPIALTGADQTVSAAVNDFNVTDARGNNKGWILRISATQFSNGAGSVLHEGALAISDASVTVQGNSDRFDGDCSVVNDISITSIPQNFIVVPESKGKGTYTVSGAKLWLDIWPKEALAGTYTSTLTVDLVTNVK